MKRVWRRVQDLPIKIIVFCKGIWHGKCFLAKELQRYDEYPRFVATKKRFALCKTGGEKPQAHMPKRI